MSQEIVQPILQNFTDAIYFGPAKGPLGNNKSLLEFALECHAEPPAERSVVQGARRSALWPARQAAPARREIRERPAPDCGLSYGGPTGAPGRRGCGNRSPDCAGSGVSRLRRFH